MAVVSITLAPFTIRDFYAHQRSLRHQIARACVRETQRGETWIIALRNGEKHRWHYISGKGWTREES